MVEPAVEYAGLGFAYGADRWALRELSTTIPAGQLTALIGHTGSGKSTLMELTDGLLLPTSGTVTVFGQQITAATKKKELAPLRKKVGFVFQFPEHQLFADSVLADVMFGPQNLGANPTSAKEAATAALTRLGLPAALFDRSPFELSGGQQRRVALAGVLAMNPQLLILDEPTAGLDPTGQAELLSLITELKAQGLTIIMITHQMEQVARLADTVRVLDGGQLVFAGTPADLFVQPDLLAAHHLTPPAAVTFAKQLDWAAADPQPLTAATLAAQLAKQLKGGTGNG